MCFCLNESVYLIIIIEFKVNLCFLPTLPRRHDSWSHKHSICHLHCTYGYYSNQLSVFKPIANDYSVHDRREQGWHSRANHSHPGPNLLSHHFRDGSGDGGGPRAVCGTARCCPVTHQCQLCRYGCCCCRAQPRTDGLLPVHSRVSTGHVQTRPLIITSAEFT